MSTRGSYHPTMARLRSFGVAGIYALSVNNGG
jgi:hypothetical protein